MKTYKSILVLANRAEWEKHLQKVKTLKGTKSEEELVRMAFTFNFVFDSILKKICQQKGVDFMKYITNIIKGFILIVAFVFGMFLGDCMWFTIFEKLGIG